MGSHSVTCHPAEVTFPPLPQSIKAGTRFSDPRGMQGWVDLVGLVTYRGGIPARRRSPIPALTGLNVEQLHSCDERRYHTAKPSTWYRYINFLSTFYLLNHILLCSEHVEYSSEAWSHHAGRRREEFWSWVRCRHARQVLHAIQSTLIYWYVWLLFVCLFQFFVLQITFVSVNVNQNFLVWQKLQNYYEVHRGIVESKYKIRKWLSKKKCLRFLHSINCVCIHVWKHSPCTENPLVFFFQNVDWFR